MKQQNLSAEQIDSNMKKVNEFVQKLGDRTPQVNLLIEKLGERFALCPASAKLEQHNCFPGGLVDHSLRVLTNTLKICKAFEYDIPLESLIITSLFHDLGKIGDLSEEYYLDQDSQWHRDKTGAMYKYNPKCQFMTVPHRSVWLLQEFGIKLSQDEWSAIVIHDGQYVDDNKSYKMKECNLANILHMADFLACKQEREL